MTVIFMFFIFHGSPKVWTYPIRIIDLDILLIEIFYAESFIMF